MRLLGNMTSPETTFWVNPVEGGRCLCSKVNRLAPRTDGGVVGAHKIRSLVTAMVSAAILCSVAMAVAATKSAAKKKEKKATAGTPRGKMGVVFPHSNGVASTRNQIAVGAVQSHSRARELFIRNVRDSAQIVCSRMKGRFLNPPFCFKITVGAVQSKLC